MNKCYFTGRTTKEIDLRYTQENTAVGNFSIAVDTGYGDNKKANFFNCTAWGKTAESMEKYVKKGTKIVLECEARQNTYNDKNGNKVSAINFVVLSWEFAESKASGDNKPQTPPPTDEQGFMSIPDGVDDELPFN